LAGRPHAADAEDPGDPGEKPGVRGDSPPLRGRLRALGDPCDLGSSRSGTVGATSAHISRQRLENSAPAMDLDLAMGMTARELLRAQAVCSQGSLTCSRRWVEMRISDSSWSLCLRPCCCLVTCLKLALATLALERLRKEATELATDSLGT